MITAKQRLNLALARLALREGRGEPTTHLEEEIAALEAELGPPPPPVRMPYKDDDDR
jgi:hypothetical protein